MSVLEKDKTSLDAALKSGQGFIFHLIDTVHKMFLSVKHNFSFSKKNPYANSDGSPKDGYWMKFYEFEKKKKEARFKRMSALEKEEYLKGRDRFFQRMQS